MLGIAKRRGYQKCAFPMKTTHEFLSPDNKIAGILTPVSAIRGENDIGIGDTESLVELAGWAAKKGFGLIQILPVNETGADHSPYNILSSIAYEPSTLSINPKWLPDIDAQEFKKITKKHNADALRSGPVRYAAVKEMKREALRLGFANLRSGKSGGSRTRAFEKFVSDEEEWIADYALFRALSIWNGGDEVVSDLGTLLTLAKEGVIHGVKDSSGNDAGIRAVILGIQKLNLKDFVVLTGSELTVDSALMFGSDGVIPGIGNIDPAGYVKIYDLVQKGDFAAARKEQERLFEMFGLVDVGAADRMGRGSSAIGAFKAGLKLLGIIEDARTAPPAIPLNENEIAAIKPFLERAGLKLK